MCKKDFARAAFALAGLLAATAPASAQTWTQTSAPSNYWISVASSADGTKLAAASSDAVYLSADSGVTWTPSSLSGALGLACSADGNKLVAAGYSIYASTNSGVTWTATSVVSLN